MVGDRRGATLSTHAASVGGARGGSWRGGDLPPRLDLLWVLLTTSRGPQPPTGGGDWGRHRGRVGAGALGSHGIFGRG